MNMFIVLRCLKFVGRKTLSPMKMVPSHTNMIIVPVDHHPVGEIDCAHRLRLRYSVLAAISLLLFTMVKDSGSCHDIFASRVARATI
jgi:hypothetical protein